MRNIPLTPMSGGGLCLDQRSLQPADIIVSTTNHFVSGGIKIATGSVVSHASLYAGNGRVNEAVGDDKGGVRNAALYDAINGDTLAVAYRHRQMTPGAANKIVQFAQNQVGKSYDTSGAIGAGLQKNRGFGLCVILVGVIPCTAARTVIKESQTKFFCSELVLAAYKAGGLSVLSIDPSRSVPNDIVIAYSNGVFGYVGHLIA